MSDRFQRDLMRGSLDLLVLSVVAREPQYGYSIQKQLNLATDGKVKMPAGTLYPLLHRLETEKLVRCRWDDSTGRKRKWYEITAKGKKTLNQRVTAWQQYATCVSDLLGVVTGRVDSKTT